LKISLKLSTFCLSNKEDFAHPKKIDQWVMRKFPGKFLGKVEFPTTAIQLLEKFDSSAEVEKSL
jgi:hypothetical protein